MYLFYITSYPHEEVNCTEPSPLVSVPWHNLLKRSAVPLKGLIFQLQVIKTPMDLGTIRQKIENGVYLKKEEAIEDLVSTS